MKMHTQTLEPIVCIFLSISLALARKYYAPLSELDGKTCGDALFTINILSLIGCLIHCANNPACVAAFHKPDGTCAGCPRYATRAESAMQDDTGTRYFYDQGSCGIGWVGFEGYCFLVETRASEWRSWTDAKTFCEGNGAMLAEVKTSTEQAFLVDKLSKSKLPNPDYLAVWIGGYNFTGSWKWAGSMESIDPIMWGSGEPNGELYGIIQNCLSMYSTLGYRWSDDTCTTLYPFICEIDNV